MEESGIWGRQVLEFTASKGKIVIRKLEETSGFVCDRDCEHCLCLEDYD